MGLRLFLALVPLALALAGPACARGGETLDNILPQIRAAHPGQLSDAQSFTGPNGATHYRIKWMTPEGRILYFDADANTGRYSSSGGEDGGQWRGGDGHRSRGNDRGDADTSAGDGGGGHHRNNWNGGLGDGGVADWHDRHGGGDWPDHNGGGDGHGYGDWRGGHDEGDNGGWHHQHGGN